MPKTGSMELYIYLDPHGADTSSAFVNSQFVDTVLIGEDIEEDTILSHINERLQRIVGPALEEIEKNISERSRVKLSLEISTEDPKPTGPQLLGEGKVVVNEPERTET